MCGFCNVCACKCGCFGNTCICTYCALFYLYCVFLYCLVYVYLLLFVCLYQCKDKCHQVTTQMLLIIIIIIIIITITEFDHSAFLCAFCTVSCSILTVNLIGVYNDTEN